MLKESEIVSLPKVAPGDRMTDDEFFQFAPEDRKAELIGGVLVMPSPAYYPHEDRQGFLLTTLRAFVRHNGLGVVLGSRTAVHLQTGENYEPDILFVAASREQIVRREGIFGAPDLVVELLSPGTATLDWGVKRRVYAQSGVRELWMIDPNGQDGSAFFQRDESGLKEVSLENGLLRSLAVPGFYLRAEWLWPASGELPDEIGVLKELGVV
jgi:Uma2 family endonuclease